MIKRLATVFAWTILLTGTTCSHADQSGNPLSTEGAKKSGQVVKVDCDLLEDVSNEGFTTENLNKLYKVIPSPMKPPEPANLPLPPGCSKWSKKKFSLIVVDATVSKSLKKRFLTNIEKSGYMQRDNVLLLMIKSWEDLFVFLHRIKKGYGCAAINRLDIGAHGIPDTGLIVDEYPFDAKALDCMMEFSVNPEDNHDCVYKEHLDPRWFAPADRYKAHTLGYVFDSADTTVILRSCKSLENPEFARALARFMHLAPGSFILGSSWYAFGLGFRNWVTNIFGDLPDDGINFIGGTCYAYYAR
ncbi:hypothetical protein ACFL6Y_03945 [Elusimicrobiota bacterium]